MATPIEIQYRIAGADQVAGALQQMENRARQMAATMTSTMAPARQGVAALSSSLSHAASLMQLAGGSTSELAQRLQTAILVVSSATVAIQALRGITLSWAGVMAIANTAMVSLATTAATIGAVITAPLTIALAAIAALGLGFILLRQSTDDTNTATARLSTSLREFSGSARVLAGDLFTLTSGLEDYRFKIGQLAGQRLQLFGTQQEKEAADAKKRLAEVARREGEAQKTLADRLRETRMQRDLDLIVQTNVAERARATVEGLRQQTQWLRDVKDASIDWAEIERDLVNPAMRAAVDLFLSFKTPAEEGVIQPTNQITENLEEVADAARQAARVLGVDWTEALTLGRQALQLAKDEGVSLADALARIKFNRDFLKELALVDSGMKKWFDTWEKFKFGAEDFAINVAPSIGKALDPVKAKMEQLAAIVREILVPAFTQLFTDILSGAKSFGEGLMDFFRNIVNAIINIFAQRLALRVVNFLLPIFGLAAGGIVAGGLMPLVAAQAGGVISRPTLALVGEGRQSEAVVPLPDNRSIPVKFMDGRQARGDGGREAIIHLTIHNVIGDPRALGIPTAGDIAGVIVNDVSRRGPTIQAIRVALNG